RLLAKRRQQSRFLALSLKSQRDHRVGAIQRQVEVGLVRHAMRELSTSPCGRNERRRTGQRDPRAEWDERVDVRARDAAVQDVADDDDALFFETAERV